MESVHYVQVKLWSDLTEPLCPIKLPVTLWLTHKPVVSDILSTRHHVSLVLVPVHHVPKLACLPDISQYFVTLTESKFK